MENVIPKSAEEAIEELSRKYLWWKAIAAEGHTTERMVAQIMNLGTYKDIRKLEAMLSPKILASVMANSAPGWFDDRSWDFWRGRLSFAGVQGINEHRPQRTFPHADMH